MLKIKTIEKSEIIVIVQGNEKGAAHSICNKIMIVLKMVMKNSN